MALLTMALMSTPEAAIAGVWKDSERSIVVVIAKQREREWAGRVLSSPRAEEVAYSGPIRSPIPVEADQRFRLMSITDSGRSRSP